MTRPTLSDVTDWHDVTVDTHAAVGITVLEGTLTTPDGFRHPGGAFSVRHEGKPRYFYGETAWSDAARYADDLYFEARRNARIAR